MHLAYSLKQTLRYTIASHHLAENLLHQYLFLRTRQLDALSFSIHLQLAKVQGMKREKSHRISSYVDEYPFLGVVINR